MNGCSTLVGCDTKSIAPMPKKPEKRRLPLVVVAGAVPPPVGGQAMMIQQIVQDLAKTSRFQVQHVVFRFTQATNEARRASIGKIIELVFVWIRLIGVRFRCGRIHCALYPVGGPQLVPTVRDIFLLPAFLLLSRHVVLHFHAGGVPETIEGHPLGIGNVAKFLYRRVSAGIVLTNWGKTEPDQLGIPRSYVVPLQLEDRAGDKLIGPVPPHDPPEFFNIGHLCQEKGTLVLLEALSMLKKEGLRFRLKLAGECLFPFDEEQLSKAITRYNLDEEVEILGVLAGQDKEGAFESADVFIFPSLARESFGIVIAEAMMHKLPVVAFDHRANSEVLGGHSLSYLAPWQFPLANSLARTLKQCIADRGNWRQRGELLREKYLRDYSKREGQNHLADTLAQIMAK
jgi:glycosyltransferase involved in cell wall biosynthesis